MSATIYQFPVQAREPAPTTTMLTRPEGGFTRPTRSKVVIADTSFHYEAPEVKKKAAEPIKDQNDINRVAMHLLSQQRHRDYLLFICGINFGLRASDLLDLRVGHVVTASGAIRDHFDLVEKKTKDTRKVMQVRTIYINEAVVDALCIYLDALTEQGVAIRLDDPLFPNYSNNGKAEQKPMTRRGLDTVLKKIVNEECGLPTRAGTHCLRKTFAYHFIMSSPDRSRAIETLQRVFGHSSQTVTLHYAGITDDEIMQTYRSLNLGSLGKLTMELHSQLELTKEVGTAVC